MLLQERLETQPFTTSEKQVVDYLLEQQRNIQNKTTAEIAAATFSSKSTLVRIAKKLNYSGWTALKADFLNELDYLEKSVSCIDANYPFTKRDSLMTIANKIARLEIESIEDTLSLITHDDLRRVVDMIARSSEINIFAASNNLLVAQEFSHQMSRIKKEVKIHSIQGEIFFNAYLAKQDSCGLIITYSGETGSLNQVAKLLVEQNIPVITITSMGENTTARYADAILRLCTREKLYSKISTYSTDAAINYLLNVIYSCVFALDYDANVALKIASSKKIENDRFSDSEILRE
ncbi:sugar isomerase [Enterococcus sp. HMSC29A04]|uniref:MurR/RpiR family transcriptional regulator n=1 Tax=Enterococcus TaxID=1350 RepID=UPI0007F417DF|nr:MULTISPECIES: MurR/RpiR family transcriptional regulator [Enterococcus]SAZ39363.1 phosphosugar-binding transcriptional regulator [Enterococcus faecium]MDT2570188.1 MurR/RpiR family transcriptional regulator [Enterococcus raffinosus]OFT87705.1 sugar isomerase [Enterococcus sp. HMSC29A04]OFU58958.1 sugar isomerase [Enterococcus sp. HMSC14A10]QXJ61504.1 MurR/RpiR family transcriptional regulator [Enterococcus raffinosus]